MSRCLSDRGIEHVVLERGRIAERWRSERWDSLRLLTPNWMTRLPGFHYDGPDPDGFMTMPEVVEFLERYARRFAAPVVAGTTVTARDAGRARLSRARPTAARGARAPSSSPPVTATCRSCRRSPAGCAPRHARSSCPRSYRDPAQLPPGGVLVVGASATGVQLADEMRPRGPTA